MSAGPKADSTARGAIFTLGGSVVGLILTLLTVRLLARSLGPTLKGGYDTLSATTSIGVTLFSLCLYTGVTYTVARNPDAKTRKLAELLIGVSLLQGLVALVVLFALSLSPLRNAFIPAGYGIFAPLAVAGGTTTGILVANFRAFLAGWRRLAAATGVDVSVRALTLLLVWLVLRHPFGNLTLDRLAIAATIAAALVIFVVLIFLVMPMTNRDGKDFDFKELTKYSLANLFGAAVYELNLRLGIFLVLRFLQSTTEVAIYAAALQMAQLIWLPSTSLQAAVFPRLAGIHDEVHRSALFARALRVNGVVVVCASLVFVLVAPKLMGWLFGPGFGHSIPLALTMVPAVALSAIGTNISAALNSARGKPQFNGYGSAIGLVVFLSVGIAVIPRMGLNGAVIAASASYICSTAYVLTSACQFCKIGPKDLLQIRRSDFVEIEHAVLRFFKSAGRGAKG